MGVEKTIGRLFIGVGNRLNNAFAKPSIDDVRRAPWYAANGDATHRVEYDLNEHSIVFDFGGYKGDWSAEIAARYGCTIHIFEGVDTYAANIAKRFVRNPKIHVHAFGLSKADSTQTIQISEERSSQFNAGGESKTMRLVKASDFLAAEHIEKLALAKSNIEGGEYDLLEHLLDSGNIAKFVNVQVQFHDFAPNAKARMKAIQDRLRQTHELTYEYPFVWENWRLKILA